jgi:GNAT superfamily N-acetyltransferase
MTSAGTSETSSLIIRPATEADLEDIAAMVDDFVKGHPAESRPRPISQLRAAFLNTNPVSHLLVAARHGRVVGMGQWTRIYDMFWAMFGGHAEWLYVRPEARGLGVAAAIIAECCRQIRLDGGEFLRAGAEEEGNSRLYERVAIGWPARTCNVGGEAFQVFADLAGAPPRDIVRGLPPPQLNHAPARPR